MHELIWLIKEVELWAETCHTLGLTSRLHNVFLLCLWRAGPPAALDKMDGTLFKKFLNLYYDSHKHLLVINLACSCLYRRWEQ